MIKKSGIILIAVLVLILTGCPDITTTDSTDYDPDPVETTVDPAEDLYIVANVAGHIVGFDASAPESYTIFVTDASTEEYFSDIRISPDLKHLLYARVNEDSTIDLVLFDIETSTSTVLAEEICSNESEFIDNNTLQYSYGGDIYRHTISTGVEVQLFNNNSYNCIHGGQVSPDGTRLVFKNQDPSQTEYAQVVWVGGIPATDDGVCVFPYTGGIDLAEPFYFNWRDNDRIICKTESDATSLLLQYNIEDGYTPPATVTCGSETITFSKLAISPSGENLLLYGNKAVYMLDLGNYENIGGNTDVEVDEVYSHDDFTTRYAAIGSESKSFVVGTYNWMGIYNIDGLEKTSVSLSNITDTEGVLYGLHCR